MIYENFDGNYIFDPVRYLGLTEYKDLIPNNIRLYYGVGYHNIIKDVKFIDIYIDLEQPNFFFNRNITFYDKFDFVLCICPCTCDILNKLTNTRKFRPVFFPINPSFGIIANKDNDKDIDIFYTGHYINFFPITSIHSQIIKRLGNSKFEELKKVMPTYIDKLNILARTKIALIHNVLGKPIIINNVSDKSTLINNKPSYKLWNTSDEFLPQLKSRVIEAALSKCIMLVFKDPFNIIENYFVENEDFIYFTDENDLDNKVEYVLGHIDEYRNMIDNAYNKTISYYTNKNFMSNINLYFIDRYIVTTTINKPTFALMKYLSFKNWIIIVVGDKKTPHNEYKKLQGKYPNLIYMHPDSQDALYPELSDLIGWNKIQRRTIGYLEAYKRGANIIASVDDDNIPFDDWDKHICIGKETEVYYYETDNVAFDPLSATNCKHLWHRGFPLQTLKNRNYKVTRKIIKPDIQAGFWNGDPDIDAVCRMEHAPNCMFDNTFFPFASNAISPFNQQNTFLSRNVIKNYLALPFIGRMDDIWPSYYAQVLGFHVIYTKATVFQDRNIQNLTKNLVDEFIGYEKTEQFINKIIENKDNFESFLPENALNVWKQYKLDISQSID